MREKLIELLKEADRKAFEITESRPLKHPFEVWELQADHLIANGVRLEQKQATSKTSDKFASDTNVGDKWVSTAERLPDVGRCVIAYNAPAKCASEALYKGEGKFLQFRWAARLQEQEVTHWMPLPEPPKGE